MSTTDVQRLIDNLLPDGKKCQALTMYEVWTAIIEGEELPPVSVEAGKSVEEKADTIVAQLGSGDNAALEGEDVPPDEDDEPAPTTKTTSKKKEMTEDKLAEAIARAQRARELLENEILAEVVEELKQECVELAMTTEDSLKCNRARHEYQAFDRIKAKLQIHMTNGRAAQRELEEITSGRKRQQFGVV